MGTDGPSDSSLTSSRWPDAYGSVYRDAVPDGILTDILKDADAVADCPNFWTPKAAVTTAGEARTAYEAAMSILYHKIMRHWLPEDWAGAEWWVQVYERGKGLAFHFDKDEHLFKVERHMVHPLMSSVLYLTGATFPKRLGPTVVVDQRFDNSTMRASPEDPQRCALIYPRRGAFAVFDGALGHGVLGSAAPDLRATLLINWWPHQPQGVNAITREEAAERKLSIKCWPSGVASTAPNGCSPVTKPSALPMQVLSLGTSQTSAAVSASSAEQQDVQSAMPNDVESYGDCSSCSAAENKPGEQPDERQASDRAAVVANIDRDSCRATNSPEQGVLLGEPFPVMKLPTGETAEGVVSVDDLLHSKGLSLLGSRAISSVAVDHTGWALYPLGDEAQLEQAEGDAPLQTAAVFVPLHMMPAASSSESEGEEEET